jgi:hypothetical protein
MRIIPAAQHEESHRWVPLEALEVPYIDSKVPCLLLSAKDQTGTQSHCWLWQGAHRICGSRGEVAHVGPQILDDAGLDRRRDVSAGVRSGADGDVVCLQRS